MASMISEPSTVFHRGMKKKAELVLIPSPGIGHLVSTAEVARLLVKGDDRLLITVLIMKLPFDSKFAEHSRLLTDGVASDRIRFVDLPLNEAALDPDSKDIVGFYMETYKTHVRDAVSDLTRSRSVPDAPRLVGFIVDMFSTTMIDVANEFGLPSYVFFTSNASLLSLMFHLQALRDDHNVDVSSLSNSDSELVVPGFSNPVPARFLPSVVMNKHAAEGFLNFARRYKKTEGIIVNTFSELESRMLDFLLSNNRSTMVPIYPVGPILNTRESDVGDDHKHILQWLDRQPSSSVVFLCFGSMGSFGEDQVGEIARALEQSGHRFLWSLRRPPPNKIDFPTDYENPELVLPEGFTDRTKETGRIIGWAPQVAILNHPAVGGFVTHCGWNSILESIWAGTPFAAWPMYAEQQFNAYQMVVELGLAVEIKIDYRKDHIMLENHAEIILNAREIERGIRRLMELDSEERHRVKEMSIKSRQALMDGGSSSSTLSRLIRHVMNGHKTENLFSNSE